MRCCWLGERCAEDGVRVGGSVWKRVCVDGGVWQVVCVDDDVCRWLGEECVKSGVRRVW